MYLTNLQEDRMVKSGKEEIYVRFINYNNEKPLLVLLHEGLGSIEQWKDFPQLIAEATKLPVMVYDRRGYGKSSPLKKSFQADYMHQEALEEFPTLLRELNIKQKLILIGHSDGGSIALLYASAFPDKVEMLISLAAHVFVENISVSGIQEAENMYKENVRFREALKRYHSEKTDEIFCSWAGVWLSGEFRNWNIEECLPGIKAPVLALQGDQDQYGTEKQVDSIVSNVRGKSIKYMISDCGHSPHKEQKDITLKEIVHFIKVNINPVFSSAPLSTPQV
jgi:pimeloyl-ACP methyl ester carboxylesterase